MATIGFRPAAWAMSTSIPSYTRPAILRGSKLTTNRTCLFFFFQAEDGIRDIGVTGVQTCALPIFAERPRRPERRRNPQIVGRGSPRRNLGSRLQQLVLEPGGERARSDPHAAREQCPPGRARDVRDGLWLRPRVRGRRLLRPTQLVGDELGPPESDQARVRSDPVPLHREVRLGSLDRRVTR